MPKPGEMDTTYASLLEAENKIRLLEPFKGAKAHHQMQCIVCGHIWTATPISKRQTLRKNGVSGCPACNIARKDAAHADSRHHSLEELKNRGFVVLSDWYDGRRSSDGMTKIEVKNIKCGHTFWITPTNLLANNVECGVCGPKKRAAKLTASSKARSEKWKETATDWQKYKAAVTSITSQTYRKHKDKINPLNLPRDKAGVEGAYHLDHIVPKRFCFENNIPAEVCGSLHNLQMLGWRENVGSRDNIKGTIPPIFLKYISTNSKLEQYATQLKNIFPDSETFVSIGGVVVTAYDAATNYAVVVLPIDKTYADKKAAKQAAEALSAADVKYAILFEDEMLNIDLVSAKLKHYSVTNNVTRIHARQCVIRACSKEEKRALLNANHVQGNDNATIAYGAYYNDMLVAVMTFSPPRVALGQKSKTNKAGKWELSRFCTDVSYRIPGIASKLLKHFQTHHYWTEIYSYADKRWSIGNMYHQLGFDLVTNNPPDYFYVVNGVRKHRWNYRKDILKTTLAKYDSNLTEYQNMENHGYHRVWDCGTLKFSITNKNPA